jgi:hypothetical protein
VTVVLTIETYAHESGHSKPHLFRINQRDITCDDGIILEHANAPKARTWGKPNCFGERLIGHSAIDLEAIENPYIDIV